MSEPRIDGWEYSGWLRAWLWGTGRNGVGVFLEGASWSCNVVVGGDIVFYEGLPSREAAMNKGLDEFARLRELRA